METRWEDVGEQVAIAPVRTDQEQPYSGDWRVAAVKSRRRAGVDAGRGLFKRGREAVAIRVRRTANERTGGGGGGEREARDGSNSSLGQRRAGGTRW